MQAGLTVSSVCLLDFFIFHHRRRPNISREKKAWRAKPNQKSPCSLYPLLPGLFIRSVGGKAGKAMQQRVRLEEHDRSGFVSGFAVGWSVP
jgi:hypothetical protein